MTTLDDMQNLKLNLEQIDIKNLTAQLFFILKERSTNPIPFTIYKTIHSKKLTNNFFDIFKSSLDKIVKNQIAIVPYDINLDTNETYQYLPIQNIPNEPIINTSILNDATTQILEEVDDSIIQKMWAYAVKIKFGNEQVIYYRKYSSGKILRPGIFNALAFNGGRFSKIEENIFQIPNGIDAFFYKNEIVITQLTNFERIFGYEDIYENASQDALNQLALTHTYADIPELINFVGTDGRKKRKLASIFNNGLIPQMEFNKVSTTIQDYNLDIQIDPINQKFHLTAKNSLMFLKALNDDYLRSELTATRYEASSKRKT